MAQQSNKPRRTKLRIEQEIEKMFELMVEGRTDHEMQRMLGMSHTTYYRYKDKMYKQYGSIQRNKIEDAVYYQQQLLSDRLTRIFRILESKMTDDSSRMNGIEFSAVASMAQEIGMNILRLEGEGFRATNRNLNGVLQRYAFSYFVEC